MRMNWKVFYKKNQMIKEVVLTPASKLIVYYD